MNYENTVEAASGSLLFKPGQTRHLSVKLKGSLIEIFSEDSDKPILTWRDPNAFLLGRVGLRGVSIAWTISPLTVTMK
ncbi:hypothetical protein D3C84_1245180 [compost metagenome]